MQAFWSQGFEGTSLAELLSVTGLSRSSVYQTLGNKQSVFTRCLERYTTWLVNSMESDLLRSRSARDFVYHTFVAVADTAQDVNPRGCLLMNSAAELGQTGDPDAVLKISDGVNRITEVFLRAVKSGRKDGSISSPIADRELALFLTTCLSGLNTMVKAGCSRNAARRIVRTTMAVL